MENVILTQVHRTTTNSRSHRGLCPEGASPDGPTQANVQHPLADVYWHHHVEKAKEHRALVAVVTLADLLCRMRAVGYGYPEDRQVDFVQQPAFKVLVEECPNREKMEWERFTFEMEGYMTEVQGLVNLVYRRS